MRTAVVHGAGECRLGAALAHVDPAASGRPESAAGPAVPDGAFPLPGGDGTRPEAARTPAGDVRRSQTAAAPAADGNRTTRTTRRAP